MNRTVKINEEKKIIGESDKQKSKIIEDDDLTLLVDDPGFEITEEVIQGIKRGIDDVIFIIQIFNQRMNYLKYL